MTAWKHDSMVAWQHGNMAAWLYPLPSRILLWWQHAEVLTTQKNEKPSFDPKMLGLTCSEMISDL